MPTVTTIYGEDVKTVEAAAGRLLGHAVAATGLSLEQPCAGRGSCGKCKVLAVLPFQPHSRESIRDASSFMGGIFSEGVRVMLPPLIGGFVGSDALACLADFGFGKASGPMAVIDLGTNGEVMVTDGQRILTASTAAGPAFEGVNISCGTRTVDGAIVDVRFKGSELTFETIADEAPIGLSGSGLLSLIYELR